jgi:hypothetical protein
MFSQKERVRRSQQLISAALLTSFALAASLTVPTKEVAAIGGNPSSAMVISQVYGGAGCGTAGCSTYQNDFIELYNRSTTAVSINGWSVQYAAATGTTWQVTNLPNVTLQPGQYFLIAESSSVNGVSPLPTPDATGTIVMSATAAKVALVNCITALTGACPSNVTGACSIIDFVGYGSTANCNETANAPAPSTTVADIRAGGGNTETDNNSTDFSAAAPTPRNKASTFNSPTAADGFINGRITTAEGAGIAGTVIKLSGSQNRKTITDVNGNYHFEKVETTGFYTVAPAHVNFAFNPSERSFSQLGNSTEAAFTGSRVALGVNAIDTPEYFVRQHYLDFLGREPDEAGLNFWCDQRLGCGNDFACRERRTANVSAAYFLSIEFQQTGGLVDRLYKTSYGRNPLYAELIPDTGAISRDVVVGRSGWEQQLVANKESFIGSWVERAAFRAAYDSLSNDAYIDALVSNTELSYARSERDNLLNGLNAGSLSRANVLEQIVNSDNFAKARFNEAFVMMEYFGYLRRDPDESGYQFWLDKLNRFGGNFEQAEMVKAFIVSGEYRARFAR